MLGLDFLPLSFVSPLPLVALISLPAVWLLLRIIPPAPKQITFPPLRLMMDFSSRHHTPRHSPWWLLLLRLLIVALIILATAWPIWNAAPAKPGQGPLLLLVDNGFSAAQDWSTRIDIAQGIISEAIREERPIAIVGLSNEPAEIMLEAGTAAENRLHTLTPRPYAASRVLHLDSIERFLQQHPQAAAIWISDRIVIHHNGEAISEAEAKFPELLRSLLDKRSLEIYTADTLQLLALAGSNHTQDGLSITVVRADLGAPTAGRLRALDIRGLPLGEASFVFNDDLRETTALFKMPIEILNAISRIEIVGQNTAGAVTLLDDRQTRHRVGLVSGASTDITHQPLLSPTFYLARALEPFAEVREPHGSIANIISDLIDNHTTVIILADVGMIDEETTQKLESFIEKGGILLRFAGPHLANSDDKLVPIQLRHGKRTMGGTLSWEGPQSLASFPSHSPFYGLETPQEITVSRQILAEPNAELGRHTWAALSDGTPIVTADRRGSGFLILVHVTANTTWSNLPLSGTFVAMLEKILTLANKNSIIFQMREDNQEAATDRAIFPWKTLDGFGTLRQPPVEAKPIILGNTTRASFMHPAGFYGLRKDIIALNVLAEGDRPAFLDLNEISAELRSFSFPVRQDLRMPLFLAAFFLFMLDTLLISIFKRRAGGYEQKKTAALLCILSIMLTTIPSEKSIAKTLSEIDYQAALHTHLAYIITGNEEVDKISQAGLRALAQELNMRTSFEPSNDPIGINLETDELAFYPLIYWPITPDRPMPSDASLRKIDAYMRTGGTVIFDTRDAWRQAASSPEFASPETIRLRQMLAGLNIPELESVPEDHVITKTFFLIDYFPGRYATGETWVEALPPPDEEETRLVRGGDNVSPIIITSNDLAAAWALDDYGSPLYPTIGSDSEQREMAIRGGINIVMYSLTGSYKADQVHVPAFLTGNRK